MITPDWLPQPEEALDPLMNIEVVRHQGFGVKYERRLNLGNWESLTASIGFWVKLIPQEAIDAEGRVVYNALGEPQNLPIHLHDCKRRVREMARTNVRAQFNRIRHLMEPMYLGLLEPEAFYDPLYVKTVLLSLRLKKNLGDFHSIEPEYADHCDLRDIYVEYPDVQGANTTGLHVNLQRIWDGLWRNLEDEIGRAQGQETTDASFGLLPLPITDDTGSQTPDVT